MNILYVNGHPYDKSFHAAIEKTFTKAVDKKHNLKVLTLGKETFDPVLRYGYSSRMEKDPFITESQELVLWADHIVFTFPIWWGDAPSLLRGWIERVFTPGFAYSYDNKPVPTRRLKGKTSDIIITYRGLRPLAWLFGNYAIGIFNQNLFGLSGIKKKRVIGLGGIGLNPIFDNERRRIKFLKKVQRRAASL